MDLISRQDAIDAIKEWGLIDGLSEGEAIEILEDEEKVPSAERKGKWINYRNDDGHHIADCSICGNTLQWFDDEGGHLFCPNCGARMDER